MLLGKIFCKFYSFIFHSLYGIVKFAAKRIYRILHELSVFLIVIRRKLQNSRILKKNHIRTFFPITASERFT